MIIENDRAHPTLGQVDDFVGIGPLEQHAGSRLAVPKCSMLVGSIRFD